MRKALVFLSLALCSCGGSYYASQPVYYAPQVKNAQAQQSKPVEIVSDFKAKPIYVPPEVVRILVYPYEDENGVLHQGEFLYFTVNNGYWTIASKASTIKVKKFVSIIGTQRNLDSEKIPPQTLPVFEKPTASAETESPVSAPAGRSSSFKKNDKRVKIIKDYLKKKAVK